MNEGMPGGRKPDLAAGPRWEEAVAAAGIEPRYVDAHGRTVTIDRESALRLLEAMGVEVAPDDRERSRAAAFGLPPVIVAHDSEPTRIALPGLKSALRWKLVSELGATLGGETTIGEDRSDSHRAGAAPGAATRGRAMIALPPLTAGYYRLTVEPGGHRATLLVAPRRCWLPERIEHGERLWGVAIQLYLMRSADDWGIGHYPMIGTLARMLADHGADVIGLNPLHAMFADRPEQASPYSPASRLLLNVLNIDVSQVPEWPRCAAARDLHASATFQRRLQAVHEARQVDYPEVARLKLDTLRLLFDCFGAEASAERKAAFGDFRARRSAAFGRHCTYLALREHFASADRNANANAGAPEATGDWRTWPEAYRSPDSPAVAAFERDHADAITRQAWMQWVADEQLRAAAEAAGDAGMAIGLYRDLAVGADAGGAETWSEAAAIVRSARVGAPPDIHNPAGQDWGLPPFNPVAWRAEGYRSFIDLVRANMRHAGALRIDHVMGLQHLWWIPEGATPDKGAYVQYPLDELLAILAIESHRHRCLVIGEDLGTVPPGLRERLAEVAILSYRVLFFELDEQAGEFRSGADYPVLALTVAGNHDLPTVTGWLAADDIALKADLGRLDAGQARELSDRRQREREQVRALLGAEPDVVAVDDLDFVRRAHDFLAATPSAVMMAQWDDLTGEAEPVNVPTTSDEYPNWRRRYQVPLEAFVGDAAIAEQLRAIAATRREQTPKPATPGPGAGISQSGLRRR
jgi:4-alpha-glucanotransferase